VSGAAACSRCGTCCRQGGPALHRQDLALIREGVLPLDDLITVRRGELALQPLATSPTLVTHEFLKIKGQGGSWCCAFYDEQAKGCRRYSHRPLACRLLDCTDTGPVLAIAGQDLLTRLDCLAADDPLLPLISAHDQLCACPDLEAVSRELENADHGTVLLADLEAAVASDLAFRARAAAGHRLSLDRELFSFGRPLFQLLLPLGVLTRNTPEGLRLTLPDR
jgi:Fe-S-cluster containining protein